MRKNVASQLICAQLVATVDGSAVTSGTTTVYVTGDGTQGTGSGTVQHEGNGTWSYAPTQAETNYNHIAFTFANSSAVSAVVNVYTVSFDPHDTADLGLTNLDAAVSTRASQTSLDTLDDYVDTEVAAIKAKTDNLPASPAATSDIPSAATIADSVWDEAIAGHLSAGTTGLALNSAGSAGDPWSTSVPGAYGAGTAGYILGTNLDSTISSRASQTSLDIVDNFVDTEVAAILAAVDTEVAAIKAKTDSLTFTTAGKVDARIDYVGGNAVTTPNDFKADVSSLATSAALATVDTNVDIIVAKLPTGSISEFDSTTDTVDVGKINGSATAASHLAAHAVVAVEVTFSAGGTSTTAVFNQVDGASASTTNDVYNGRVLIFTAPAGLKYQATDVTDYDGATKTATITAVTAAVGDTATAILV